MTSRLTQLAGVWRIATAAAAAMAAALLADALAGAGPLALDRGSPIRLDHVLDAAGAVALLTLARGLWRGRRRAADLTAIVLAALAAVLLAEDSPLPGTLLAIGLAASLFVTRDAFGAGGAAGSGRRAGVVVVVAVCSAYALGAIDLLSADRGANAGAALEGAGAWLLAGQWWLRSGQPLALTLDGLFVLSIGAAAVMLHGLLRPAVPREGHSAAEHEQAVALVAAHGHDSLAPFALREDKAFHFAADGMLAYRVVGATAIVSGDPIGPAGTAPAILASFEHFAEQAGWDVVVTAAGDEHLADYRAAGFRTLRIGAEAVVDPTRFSLEGRAVRKVRQSVARLQRRGWTVEIARGRELTDAAAAGVEAVDRAWRAGQPRLTGFAMTLGRLWGAREDEDALYVLARDPQAKLQAFLRFVPYCDGLSLDVMRRTGGEPNGLTEALVVAALAHAQAEGVREVSLNFAGFAHLMASDAALGRGQRLTRWALRRAHGRFQLERLVAFNDKFFPVWRSRHLVHRGALRLPRAALRVLQAEAYVRPPRPRPLPARWRPGLSPVVSGASQAARPRPPQAMSPLAPAGRAGG